MKKRFILGFAAGAILTSVVAMVWHLASDDDASTAPVAASDKERQVLYWTDPMVPGFRSDKPGKSPFMDMELVPVYADDPAAANVIAIKPEIANSLGMRTAKVVRASPTRRIDAQGYLFSDAKGLSVLVDLFDRDADVVRAGQAAEVRTPALPGSTFKGVVKRVETDIDVGLRSVKATIRIQDPDAALKPNLSANVTVQATGGGPRLLVPRSALIHTGRRTAAVRALGGGRFKPVPVVAGNEYGDQVEIVRGLAEGDDVVTSGQFLIDSEASVRATFDRMQSEEGQEAKAPAKTKPDKGHGGREVQP
jgi:hypothetical protein